MILARLFQHSLEEQTGDLRFHQSVAILGEDSSVPHLIIHRQSHEPAEQQVVVQLLHQHPFTSHRVQKLQQQSTALIWQLSITVLAAPTVYLSPNTFLRIVLTVPAVRYPPSCGSASAGDFAGRVARALCS